MKVMIVKELMTGEVSPVAMFLVQQTTSVGENHLSLQPKYHPTSKSYVIQ